MSLPSDPCELPRWRLAWRANVAWTAASVATAPPLASMRRIAQQVADRHGLTLADLTGRSRCRAIAHPRHEAFALIYRTGRYSLPQIGRLFNRDHTTVLQGIWGHEDRRAGRPSRRRRGR